MQRIFMEKKTMKNKDETAWVNIQHLKKTDKRQKKKDKLKSGKHYPGMSWRGKSKFLTITEI